MNKLKPNLPLSDLEEDQRELPLISPEESQVLPNGEPSDVPRTNGDPPSEPPLCINNNTTTVSQAYGGARPKTIRARLRNANSEVTSSSSSSRGRQSESSVGVEIRVISCDNSNGGGGGGETSILPHQDISNVPRLETRPAAPARHEVEVEQTENVTEDDCYIYTYIGGTAYLSADLPNSFFR